MKLDKSTESAILVLKNATVDTDLVAEMGAFGFKIPGGVYSSVGLVWVGKDFVIKNSFLSGKGKPKKAAPQKKLGTICNLAGWVCQARCAPIPKKEWQRVMTEKKVFSAKEQEEFDLNPNNVGKYNGEVVAFDW